jgi:hypothetical protein
MNRRVAAGKSVELNSNRENERTLLRGRKGGRKGKDSRGHPIAAMLKSTKLAKFRIGIEFCVQYT